MLVLDAIYYEERNSKDGSEYGRQSGQNDIRGGEGEAHRGIFVQEGLLLDKGLLEHKGAIPCTQGGGLMTLIPYIEAGTHCSEGGRVTGDSQI